ncbi:hypothetical protein LX16_0222 [Stackebrandtia albiflava]|uniref:Uncharacterized protein n=1 Tax=Stackebrandtia albiflava TaxID=406432 RepID=A0A562V9P4_9ACTN|nr:hypothetical protein [Stackebrandtia albiflava]TWJ14537.1 hypothetical protein LX16_0222 [Stackebrandtia albiflava]
MIRNGIEYFPVTDDVVVALLREKEADGAGAHELADYAATELGLRPPDHQPGDPLPLIVEVFPPDMDHGVYVWNIHEYFDEELGEDQPSEEQRPPERRWHDS